MGATTKSPLFSQIQPGGVNTIIDEGFSTGNRWFVDSGASDCSDTAGYGINPMSPFATIDYAISACTANNGDIIYVMPGHLEDLAAATIDFDIAGITCIGLGNGTDRPMITYDHADASVNIGANNVRLKNLTFRPSVTVVKIGVDIEAGVTNTVIEDCEFLEGEEGDGIDEFVLTIDLKVACNDTIIRNNVFKLDALCNGCTDCIKLSGASERITIEGNYISGNYSTAGITGITTLSKDVLIKDNVIKVKDGEPGIQLYTGTTGTIVGNSIESTGIAAGSAIVADACGWIQNYAVVADGATAVEIGGDTAIGTTFTITKTFVHSTIVTTASAAMTGASSGGLELISGILQNGSTATGSGASGAVIEFYTNNVVGKGNFWTQTEANVAAEAILNSTKNVYLESGKLIYAIATTESFTSTGNATVILTFRRVTDGATIAAA